ncbi:hypothetical protein FALCPG4_014418 [Fusarium falciforme]
MDVFDRHQSLPAKNASLEWRPSCSTAHPARGQSYCTAIPALEKGPDQGAGGAGRFDCRWGLQGSAPGLTLTMEKLEMISEANDIRVRPLPPETAAVGKQITA